MSEKLERLRSRIDDAKESLAEKKAEHKLLVQRLQEEFNVKTLDAAKSKLEVMEKELDKKQKRKESLIEKIEEMLDEYEGE